MTTWIKEIGHENVPNQDKDRKEKKKWDSNGK